MKGDAIAKKHSTISEAIGVGVAMNARRVLLTHFSQRYSKLPTVDDLDKEALELEDAEEAGLVEAPAAEDPLDDVRLQDRPINDLLHSLDPGQQDDKQPIDPHQEDVNALVETEDKLPQPPNTDMKVGIAFDYMSVLVKDIMLLEKFTPALRELYKDRSVETNGRPESSASIRPAVNGQKEESKADTTVPREQERPDVDGTVDGTQGKGGDRMEGVENGVEADVEFMKERSLAVE